ncbi:hypothetical protein J6TS7_63470 [Paenibacillus dendritiformis]|nr:hypothetical protein [Bacillus cereus]GIO82737.1 hypothetical protein J6TS7_63470 [Paenibacillus dendritiformis]
MKKKLERVMGIEPTLLAWEARKPTLLRYFRDRCDPTKYAYLSFGYDVIRSKSGGHDLVSPQFSPHVVNAKK